MTKGTSTTELTVYSPDGDECLLNVEYSWYYDAGVMYHADGSGTPPDAEAEVKQYTANEGDLPDWVTDDLVNEQFDAAMLDGTIEFDMQDDYEPDFD